MKVTMYDDAHTCIVCGTVKSVGQDIPIRALAVSTKLLLLSRSMDGETVVFAAIEIQ